MAGEVDGGIEPCHPHDVAFPYPEPFDRGGLCVRFAAIDRDAEDSLVSRYVDRAPFFVKVHSVHVRHHDRWR